MAGTTGGVVRMGLSGLPAERIAELVAASCAAQGVPVKVSDPTVVRRVGVLLGGPVAGSRAHPRSGSTRPGSGRSVAPHDRDTGGVEPGGSRGAGPDAHVVEQGSDDGVLSVQVQACPGAA